MSDSSFTSSIQNNSTPSLQLEQTNTCPTPKKSEPTITFSPDRTSRFQSKSRTSSITSDFDNLGNVEVSGCPQTQTPVPKLLPSSNVPNNQNHQPLSLHDELNFALISNGNGTSPACGLQPLMMTSTNNEDMINPKTIGNNSTPSTTISNNPPGSTTMQLQKKLEKKIAQASAIAAAMNSMSPTSNSNPNSLFSSPLTSPKEQNEFSNWTDSSASTQNAPNATKEKDTVADSDSTSNTSTGAKAGKKNVVNSSSKASRNKEIKQKSVRMGEERKPACVKFQESEVQIISKSSRGPGGLIPPERLAIPKKHRKQDINEEKESGSGGNNPASDKKPLVEWDSEDESEEELSFFPVNKANKAKLTDNLSIDNLSLSGDDEEDLHLSPPRGQRIMNKQCPCDPREWISDNVTRKISRSSSFMSGQSGHCSIS